jgi:hypothetical protein
MHKSTHENKEKTLSLYKRILDNSNILEPKNLMVHFVPQHTAYYSLQSLACKLTKRTWKILSGKRLGGILMEDGTRRSLEEMDIEQEDLIEMLRAHRNRKKGPWFLRFLPKTIT